MGIGREFTPLLIVCCSRLVDFDPEIDRTYRRRLRRSAQDVVRTLTFEEPLVSEESNSNSGNLEKVESGTKEVVMAAESKTVVEYT